MEQRRAQAAQRRTRLEDWGQGTRGKRTWNMPHMFVTLDVSKLSGWLNAFADCRESKGGRMTPLVESRQPVLLEPGDSLGPADRVWDDRLVLEVALRRRDVEPG